MKSIMEINLPEGWLKEAMADNELSVAQMEPGQLYWREPGWFPKERIDELRAKYRERFRWHTGEEL